MEGENIVTQKLTREEVIRDKMMKTYDKKMMNTIKLLQAGVEGVEMRTPDPEFGFGEENSEEEVEIYSITCDINPRFRKKMDVDYQVSEMTAEQKEVYDALFMDDDEAEVEIIADEEDEDGKIYNKVVETGDNMEGFVQKAMGGQKPVFKGLKDGTFTEKDVLIVDPLKNRKKMYGDSLIKNKPVEAPKTKTDAKGVEFQPFLSEITEEKMPHTEIEENQQSDEEEIIPPPIDERMFSNEPEVDLVDADEHIPEEIIEDELMGYMDASSEEEVSDDEDVIPAQMDDDEFENFDINLKDVEEIDEDDFPALSANVNLIPMPEGEDLMMNEIASNMQLENMVSQTLDEQYKDDENDDDLLIKPDKKISEGEFDAILDSHLRSMGDEGRKVLKKLKKGQPLEKETISFGKKPEGTVAIAQSDQDTEITENPIDSSMAQSRRTKRGEESIRTEIRPGGGMIIFRKGVKKIRGKKGKKRIPSYKGLYRMHFQNALAEMNGPEIEELYLPGMEEDPYEGMMAQVNENEEFVQRPVEFGGEAMVREEVGKGIDDQLEQQVHAEDPELMKFLAANGLDGEFDLEVDYEEGEQPHPEEMEEFDEDEDPIVKFRLHEKMSLEERVERDKLLPDTINGLRVFKRTFLPDLTYEQDVAYREANERHANEEVDFSQPPEIKYIEESIKEVKISYNPIVPIKSKEEALKDVYVVKEDKKYGKPNKKKSSKASRKYTETEDSEFTEDQGYDWDAENQDDEDDVSTVGNSRKEVLENPLVRRGKKMSKEEKKKRKELVKKMKKDRKLKKKQFKEQFTAAKKSLINQHNRRVQTAALNGLSVHKID